MKIASIEAIQFQALLVVKLVLLWSITFSSTSLNNFFSSAFSITSPLHVHYQQYQHHQQYQQYKQSTQSHLSASSSSSSSSTSLTNTQNRILTPSSNPSSFDSQSLASAKVHRYLRDNKNTNTEPQSEYVMWYHGRTSTQNEENIPPLTTGRIGRATSLNGLHWERNEEGSASEDIKGVSLGLNKESWWGFDTAHVGLGSVLLPMSTPAIMTEGGVYLMYYMGGSFEETPVGQYLNMDNPPKGNIAGMKLKIGVALSQDGISFGRVEGDDPSGAIMGPYDKSDPNCKWMTSMRDENEAIVQLEEELYCGWPEVVLNEISDKEKEQGTTKKGFFMYYSTMLKDTKEKAIAVAVSDDGIRWLKRGICLRPDGHTDGHTDTDTNQDGSEAMDADGCARCHVVQNASYDDDKGIWQSESGYTMYYEGISKTDGKHRILTATSSDGMTWTKNGLALNVGSEENDNNDWDCKGVGSPHLVRLDDGYSRMYYSGQGPNGETAIGVAKCDAGDECKERSWTREQAQLSFSEY